jgi:hypothetical protein
MDHRPVPFRVGSLLLLPVGSELVPVELPEVVPVPLVGSTDPDVPVESVVPLPTVEPVVSIPVLPRVPLLHPATPKASVVPTIIVIQPSFVRFIFFRRLRLTVTPRYGPRTAWVTSPVPRCPSFFPIIRAVSHGPVLSVSSPEEICCRTKQVLYEQIVGDDLG